MAIPADPEANDPSGLSNALTAANQGFVIAMGPDELKALLESRYDDIGTLIYVIDVRPLQEAGDEGSFKYTHRTVSNFATQAAADTVLLPAVGNDPARRGEITVLVY
jgi:hypothetical protein